jgi:hypothetical protein
MPGSLKITVEDLVAGGTAELDKKVGPFEQRTFDIKHCDTVADACALRALKVMGTIRLERLWTRLGRPLRYGNKFVDPFEQDRPGLAHRVLEEPRACGDPSRALRDPASAR